MRLSVPIALLLAVGGGLVTNLAFPQQSWWWAAILGLAMLLASLRGAGLGRGFVLGTLWGFAFFGPQLAWSLVSVTGYWAPWFALSLLQAFFIGGFAVLLAFVTPRASGREAPAAAILWVAVEQLRAVVPFGGFPWGNLAFSQVDGPLLRLAPFGGTVLVSFAIAFAAGAIVSLLDPVRTKAAVVSVAVATAVIAGAAFLPLPATSPETGELDVAFVQASVPERGAAWQSQGAAITAEYRRLTEEWVASGGEADLMLWPESAADLDPRDHPDVAESVEGAQAAVGVPIVLGTQRFPGDGTRFNEYLIWDEDGAGAAYAKQHPVPFGEYIPMRDLFRRLSSAVDRVGYDMMAGAEPGVLAVSIESLGREVLLGVGICFEVAYDSLIRENVTLGAEFLVIPTNNASFGFTQEAFQQRDMTRFRAVEHGRAAIQVATTGVTAVYLPNGEWIAGSSDELYTQATGQATIPLRESLTLASMLGEWPRYAIWVGAVIWLLAGFSPRRKQD